MKELSCGANAHVYSIDDKQRPFYWGAEVMRVDNHKSRDPDRAQRIFYRHAILELLFPDNVISVTGSFTRVYRAANIIFDAEYEYCLLSKEAAIPPEHAQYAQHMSEGRNTFYPKSCCTKDEICIRHALFHQEHDLEEAAKEFAARYASTGIHFPTDDSSDYCLGPKGIIFFEVDEFNRYQLESYLEEQKSTPEINQAKRLLSRYDVLYNHAKYMSRVYGSFEE